MYSRVAGGVSIPNDWNEQQASTNPAALITLFDDAKQLEFDKVTTEVWLVVVKLDSTAVLVAATESGVNGSRLIARQQTLHYLVVISLDLHLLV